MFKVANYSWKNVNCQVAIFVAAPFCVFIIVLTAKSCKNLMKIITGCFIQAEIQNLKPRLS